MTTKRTEAERWSVSAADYGRSLDGLTLNLLVRDIAGSLPFYTGVLGFRDLHHDPDFAALERDGMRLTLHADHTYAAQPWARRARERGHTVLSASQEWPHGWRDCVRGSRRLHVRGRANHLTS